MLVWSSDSGIMNASLVSVRLGLVLLHVRVLLTAVGVSVTKRKTLTNSPSQAKMFKDLFTKSGGGGSAEYY